VHDEFIDTTAQWGKRFVEIKVPNTENEVLRVYFERELSGLTPEELSAIWDSMGTWNSTSAQHFYNAIWKAIKEKNCG
jgi:hypothetical protein